MLRKGLVAFVGVSCLTGCGTTPLGEDYNSQYDVVVAFCPERIHIDETCATIESSTGDVVYAHALFGNAAGRTTSVTTEVIKGGDFRDEGAPKIIPSGKRRLESVQIARSAACADPNCKIVFRAYVDGDEVAAAGFAFIGR